MRSNLFFIPHELFGIPLFGWGWALGLLVLGGVIWLVFQLRAGRSASEILSSGWAWLLAVPLIVIVLPAVEMKWHDGTPIGLPIRGYGTMMLLGLLAGIWLASIRGKRIGVNLDTIVSLAIWLMVGGIAGARAFYVIQKWDQFTSSGMALLVEIVKLTEGGLVIYGGVIGGFLSAVIFCYRHRLNLFAIADLLVPGFLIGLAFGRIGCLLNGCCFGGVCTTDYLPSIQFPHGSAPYLTQLESGRLFGFEGAAKKFPRTVESVSSGSLAEEMGVKSGDELEAIRLYPMAPQAGSDPTLPVPFAAEVEVNRQTRRFAKEALPERSLPVHPSQIYASINALLLCLLTWLLQPLVSRYGMVFMIGVILYAISRFLIEWIRDDERGQFGTQLTIAQWIAVVTGVSATVGLVYLMRQPANQVAVK